MTLPSTKPLVLPASYTPTHQAPPRETWTGRPARCLCGKPFVHLPKQGRLPRQGPCCRVKLLERAHVTPPFLSASAILLRLRQPGTALVVFEHSVTLFTSGTAFQADTIEDAIRAVVEQEDAR